MGCPRAHRLPIALWILALGVAASSASAKELYERNWLEARSPNFVVTSALGERSTRNVVQDLEDFRTVVRFFTSAKVLEPRVPTLIFVFPGAVSDLGLTGPIGGYLRPGMRANYAVVRRISGYRIGHFIQHEYTHFLVRNQGGQSYPAWYDEGLADALGATDLHDGKFELGNPPPGRLEDLVRNAWIPYPRLLDGSLTPDQKLMFEPQSWALVHYLIWGRPDTDFNTQLEAYLAAREKGTPAIPAFEQSFGEDADHLARTIRSYFDHAKYSLHELHNPFDPSQISVRRMSRNEIAAALGMLCIVTGHADKARPYVDAALAANSGNARALVALAELDKFDGKFDEAKPLYERAIALEPQNDLHHLDFAEYWLDVASHAEEPGKRLEYRKSARHELVQADKLNDTNPETLAIYGSSFLAEGEDPRKGIDKLAHKLLPSQPQIKLLLATGYVRVGRTQEARKLLLAMRAWIHEGESEAVDKLLREIDEREKAQTSPSPQADRGSD